MKIIILKLPRNIKAPELCAMFAQYGAVEACDIVMDAVTGASKGFAFVEMPDEAEASAAIAALHDRQVGNQKIRVKIAEAK